LHKNDAPNATFRRTDFNGSTYPASKYPSNGSLNGLSPLL